MIRGLYRNRIVSNSRIQKVFKNCIQFILLALLRDILHHFLLTK